ncbi:phospholipase A [Azonexus sp.]|uniref:phospholipase A n=1 Tax=Azonexus sp. TaxID=1872668 RepID=UPI00359F6991
MNCLEKALFLLCLAGQAQAADGLIECAAEPDEKLRLACYDAAARLSVMNSKPLLETGDPLAAQVPVTPAAATSTAVLSSPMAKFWELGADDKRGAFIVRTYQPNYVLPFHYTSGLNRASSRSDDPAGSNQNGYRKIETKLQISLRAKVAEDLLLPGADLWFAYTQRALWQVWDRGGSAPFRSTDYQPEAIYVVPVPEKLSALPFDWKLRMLQVGLAHESNGQNLPSSRSWNRAYLGAGFERGDFSLLFRANKRLRMQSDDDNPNLTDYVGRAEVNMAWVPGVSTVSVNWRTTLKSMSRGSLQVDWTYPVFASQPAGLRWYFQAFTGYGETLIDYKHRQSSVGLGLSLFQF